MRKLFAGIGASVAIAVLTVTSAAPVSADCGYLNPKLNDPWCDNHYGEDHDDMDMFDEFDEDELS
jgi:hypothetical protein